MHYDMLKIQGAVAIVEKLNYILLTRECLQCLLILFYKHLLWADQFGRYGFWWFFSKSTVVRFAPRKKYN